MRDNNRAETGSGARAGNGSPANRPGALLGAAADFIDSAVALLALESRLAILSLIVMLAAGVIAAVLLVSVWLLILAAGAISLVQAGWPWEAVLAGMAIANILPAALCALLIRHLSRNLLFSATRRSLLSKSTGAPHGAQTDAA
ncbi:MAG: hypothetical protein ACREVE_08390 [Gammaproteobacteria bacterium]